MEFKVTGIVRRCDSLGRVVIPKSIIRSLGYESKQEVDIFIRKDNFDDLIVLKMINDGQPIDTVTGNIRRIDELDRIVIPKDIRDRMGIKEKTPVDVLIDNENNDIVLRVSKTFCLICGEEEETLIYDVEHGKKMCSRCIDFIKNNF